MPLTIAQTLHVYIKTFGRKKNKMQTLAFIFATYNMEMHKHKSRTEKMFFNIFCLMIYMSFNCHIKL